MSLNVFKTHIFNTLSATLIILPEITMGAPLGSYNVDSSHISISGISSGGYMATQMQIACSATFRGAGIIAEGALLLC